MKRKHYTEAGKTGSRSGFGYFVAVIFSVFIFAGLYGPGQAEGAISVLNAWPATPQINNVTASPATTAFTPAAGSNRIILISVHDHTNNTTVTTITASYGSNNIPARAIVNSPNNQRRQDWLFYLNEADIAAASGNTITVTSDNVGSGMSVYVATLGGVDQNTANTVAGSYSVYSPTVSYSFGVAAGGYAMFASTDSDATDPTNNEGYTGNPSVVVGSAYSYIADKLFPTAATTSPTYTTTATYSAFASAAFNPAAASTPPSESAGTLTTSPEYNNGGTYYIPNPVTITENFTSTPAVNSCQYTLNNGGSWTAGTVSGAGPYTCTASNINPGSGSLTIGMRASNDGGSTWSTLSATLSRTVDATGPTDGTMNATAASASQINLSWTAASDAGSGLVAANTYKVVRATGATAPADCTGAAVYTGAALSFSDTGLLASTQYSYRVCAYDNLSNVSAGATASATTQAGVCTYNPPTVSIGPASQNVGQGSAGSYTLTVTNNDTSSCSPSAFTLAWTNTPSMPNANFSATGQTAAIGPINPGASSPTLTFTHTAAAGAVTGTTQQTYVVASDANHAGVASNTVISTVSAPAPVPAGNWPLYLIVFAGIVAYGVVRHRRQQKAAS